MRRIVKADLHMHTSFSPDSLMPPARMVQRCVATGLTCIAVTDHNTLRGALEVRRLAPFTVIVGEEIKTSAGELVGLFLREEVPRGLSPEETAQRVHRQGGLVALPHPFDRFRRSVMTAQGREEVRPYVDIVEVFNARNTLQEANRRAVALAEEWGVLGSAVSDSHTPWELGRTYMELPEFDGTAEGFKAALAQAHLVTRPITPLIHVLTTLTKLRKRLRGASTPTPA